MYNTIDTDSLQLRVNLKYNDIMDMERIFLFEFINKNLIR